MGIYKCNAICDIDEGHSKLNFHNEDKLPSHHQPVVNCLSITKRYVEPNSADVRDGELM